MRPRRSAPALAAIITLGVVACEPHRNPSGGTTEATTRVDERGVLLLEGLGDLGPHIQAAMGTAAERAARAPYSPVGWPINRDDIVSFGRYQELQGEYGSWLGVGAPFWIGKLVFGALWTYADDDASGFYPNMEYIGHYPEKTKHEDWPDDMPAHLLDISQTEAGFLEIAGSVFKLRGGSLDNIDELKLIWTESRWLEGYTGEDEDADTCSDVDFPHREDEGGSA